MSGEGPKESTGGLAYEVILKPATKESNPRLPSPPKEKLTSHEELVKKLQQAEERRQSLELQKKEQIEKDRIKAQEARKKVLEEEERFAKETDAKLQQDLEEKEAKRKARLETLKNRLSDHLKKVSDLSKAASQEVVDIDLLKTIDKKLKSAEQKRTAELNKNLEKLKNHAKHVCEIQEASAAFSKQTEEKIVQKMEVSLRRREEQLTTMIGRIQEHDRHAEKVRERKQNVPAAEDKSQ